MKYTLELCQGPEGNETLKEYEHQSHDDALRIVAELLPTLKEGYPCIEITRW